MNIKSFGAIFWLFLSGCVSNPTTPVDTPTSPIRPTASSDFKAACPATVLRPAVFRPEEKKVLIFDGSPELTNIPAEIEWHSFTVQVEPAKFPSETTPAEYEETTQTIETERERTELYATPATYRTLMRKVLIKEAHQRWKPDCVSHAGKTGEDCIEAIPADYKEVKVEMVDIPSHTDQRYVPGHSIDIKVKKRIKQGKGTGTPIPARYETIKVSRVAKPWQIKTHQIPSRYETLETQHLLRPERVLTLPAICTESLTVEQIGRIQEKLLAQGLTLTVNQQLDKPTWQAIIKFQQDNGLDTGAITPETLIKLGLT